MLQSAAMQLQMCGTSHNYTSINKLETVHLAKAGADEFLRLAKASGKLNELVILMTCNRVEFYFTADDPDAGLAWLFSALAKKKGLAVEDVTSLLRVLSGPETVRHLFAVTSGTKSMVFGENEILTQVKEAYLFSKERECVGALMNKTFQAAVATGKRARTETQISKGAYSVSSIAIDAIRESLFDYFGRSILIVGLGVMGKRALKKLLALGHPNVNLCNRTDEKARRLAEGTTVNTLPFASLSEAVWTYDIVILAVSMKGLLFSKAEFDVSRNNTKLIVDLGLPHNVDAQLGEYLKLVSISHLKEIAERNITKRQDQKEQVERIIQEELQALLDWHTYREKQIGMEC